MLPRELPAETLDADNPGVEDLTDPASTSITDAGELAQAEARAEAARARAVRLRQLAEAAGADATVDYDDADGSADGISNATARSRKPWRPGRKALAIL